MGSESETPVNDLLEDENDKLAELERQNGALKEEISKLKAVQQDNAVASKLSLVVDEIAKLSLVVDEIAKLREDMTGMGRRIDAIHDRITTVEARYVVYDCNS